MKFYAVSPDGIKFAMVLAHHGLIGGSMFMLGYMSRPEPLVIRLPPEPVPKRLRERADDFVMDCLQEVLRELDALQDMGMRGGLGKSPPRGSGETE